MGFSKPLRCSIVSAWFAALAGVIGASPALADVTIGQLAPNSASSTLTFVTDRLQPTVTSGNTYVVPAIPPATALVIRSWSYNATGTDPGQEITMKVFRKVGEPDTYQVVGHDAPRAIAGGTLNTFSSNLPVSPGEILGSNQTTNAKTSSIFTAPGESFLLLMSGGNLADGQSAPFQTGTGSRLNISAVISPANTFSVDAITRNKKKGTAALTVNVPNPGDLSASGNGVMAAGAVSSKAIGPGESQLVIKAKGKKRRQLNEKGKVKLNVAVTYTPTSGDPRTQSVKVKLKKL